MFAAQLIAGYESIGTDLVLLTATVDHAQAPPSGLEPVRGGIYRLMPDEHPVAFPYGLRPTGVYIASRHFLSVCGQLLGVNSSTEVKDRDVRSALASQGHPIHAVDLGARVLDIGNPAGFRASVAVLTKNRSSRGQ